MEAKTRKEPTNFRRVVNTLIAVSLFLAGYGASFLTGKQEVRTTPTPTPAPLVGEGTGYCPPSSSPPPLTEARIEWLMKQELKRPIYIRAPFPLK